MIFVDASALCAVLLAEPDAAHYAAKIRDATSVLTSPIAVFETVLAVARMADGNLLEARRDVADFLQRSRISVVEIGAAEQELALDAFERYGKGRHPARLNMGDCFAYACSRTLGVPLLFKGDDFSRTDIAVA